MGATGRNSPRADARSPAAFHERPAWAVIVRRSVSMPRTLSIRRMSTRIPPRFGTAPPTIPLPPPLGTTGRPASKANWTSRETSSAVFGTTTKSGTVFHWRFAAFGREARSWLSISRSMGLLDTRSGPRMFTSRR